MHGTHGSRTAALGSSYHLGPLDHVSAEPIFLAVCFVYVSELSLDRIRIALCRLLDVYPHLSGRLVTDSLGNRVIARLGSGALLQSTSSVARLSDARDDAGRIDITRLPGGGSVLIPSHDRVGQDGGPLLSIKMTTFASNSGTVLGIRAPHSICDATGFFTIVNCLARLYDKTNLSPDWHYDQLSSVRPYFPSIETNYNPVSQYGHTKETSTADAAVATRSIEGRFLHFNNDYLRKVKAAATPAEDYTTTYRALTAHLWQISHRAADYVPLPVTGFPKIDHQGLTIAVNLRTRLPSLPSDTVFNAVLPCSTTLSSEALKARGLRAIAWEINTMLRQNLFVQPTEMESTIQWIHKQENKSQIDFRWDGHFVSTQWTCDMYTTSTLDGVRPDLVCLPFMPGMGDQLLFVLPPPMVRSRRAGAEIVEQGEGLMVLLCLDGEKWKVIDDLDLLSDALIDCDQM